MLKGNDKEAITEKTTKLTEVAGKLAERAYAEQQSEDGSDASQNPESAGGDTSSDDNVVDAEFEEVEDEKK